MVSEEQFGYRRAYKRLPCLLSATYKTHEVTQCQATCYDISYKGAGIIASEPLAIDHGLTLELNTMRSGLLSLEGTVRWCKKVSKGWQAGIMFDKILPFELERLV
ncbi:MAG: PilZ domain-containing protein [Candidatus Omnitrophota bacterium]